MCRNIANDHTCPNKQCKHFGKFDRENVRCHSFYKTKSGRRRRYRCKSCGRTFASTTGTPYYRLKKPRRKFDEVAALTVEGVSISSIARAKGLAWNTVAHWQELASKYAKRFSDVMLTDFPLVELQADELCTFVQQKSELFWLFTTLEVWSRLWVGCIVGQRTYRNVHSVLSDTLFRARIDGRFLFTTDGFEPYKWATVRLMQSICVYGQVIKQRRNNQVSQVDRRLLIGTSAQLNEMLLNSEDSETLNTSFIERLNLTIRRGSSYLNRRTNCYARHNERLDSQVSLLRCYYNFIRPHGALKLGSVVRTPAMQAGLTSKRLTFREIFTATEVFFLLLISWIKFRIRLNASQRA